MKSSTFRLPACLRKAVSLCVLLTFCTQSILPAFAQTILPPPGVRVELSPAFRPTLLRGLTVDPANPLKFDFIVDAGDERWAQGSQATPQSAEFKTESTKLIKYFLASLTTPEDDMWVNLSPYEKDRIIPGSFGTTEMGRDLLAQDYLLKQISASMLYPEEDLGRKFWERVRKEAQEKFGTSEVPVATFNKVWVVPDKAVVYEHEHTAFVTKTHLKVMLEEDYVALSHQKDNAESRSPDREVALSHQKDMAESPAPSGDVAKDDGRGTMDGEAKGRGVLPYAPTQSENAANALGTQILREIVIPELEREVNEGKNFAQLRQVYNSLILATWYKKKLKDSILAKVYVDRKKTAGIEIKKEEGSGKREEQSSVGPASSDDVGASGAPSSVVTPEEIYQQYLEAFKKGVYNYIKEDYDPATQETIPRKYVSGGFGFAQLPAVITYTNSPIDPNVTQSFADFQFHQMYTVASEAHPMVDGKVGGMEPQDTARSTTDAAMLSQQWKTTKLLAGDDLKNELLEVNKGRSPHNEWRLAASLASLDESAWGDLKTWAASHSVNERILGRMRGDGKSLAPYYSPAMELKEDLTQASQELPLFFGTERTVNQRWIEEHMDLWKSVLSIADQYQLGAHGTLNSYNQSHMVTGTPLSLHWAMLAIMLEGSVKFGERGKLGMNLGLGGLYDNAAQFGPFYILFRNNNRVSFWNSPSKEDDHLIYLVPEEKSRAFFELALQKAQAYGFITPQQANTVRSKIMTYEEFTQVKNRIGEIINGKAPADVIASRVSTDGERLGDAAMLAALPEVMSDAELRQAYSQFKGTDLKDGGISILANELAISREEGIASPLLKWWTSTVSGLYDEARQARPELRRSDFKVMEIGIGGGDLSNALATPDENGDGFNLTALDVNQDFLNAAKAASAQAARINFILADATNLNGYGEYRAVADNSQDVIAINEGLGDKPISDEQARVKAQKDHREVRSVFSEIFKKLKPGGRLVINDIPEEGEQTIRLHSGLINYAVRDRLAALKAAGFVIEKTENVRTIFSDPAYTHAIIARKPAGSGSDAAMLGAKSEVFTLDQVLYDVARGPQADLRVEGDQDRIAYAIKEIQQNGFDASGMWPEIQISDSSEDVIVRIINQGNINYEKIRQRVVSLISQDLIKKTASNFVFVTTAQGFPDDITPEEIAAAKLIDAGELSHLSDADLLKIPGLGEGKEGERIGIGLPLAIAHQQLGNYKLSWTTGDGWTVFTIRLKKGSGDRVQGLEKTNDLTPNPSTLTPAPDRAMLSVRTPQEAHEVAVKAVDYFYWMKEADLIKVLPVVVDPTGELGAAPTIEQLREFLARPEHQNYGVTFFYDGPSEVDNVAPEDLSPGEEVADQQLQLIGIAEGVRAVRTIYLTPVAPQQWDSLPYRATREAMDSVTHFVSALESIKSLKAQGVSLDVISTAKSGVKFYRNLFEVGGLRNLDAQIHSALNAGDVELAKKVIRTFEASLSHLHQELERLLNETQNDEEQKELRQVMADLDARLDSMRDIKNTLETNPQLLLEFSAWHAASTESLRNNLLKLDGKVIQIKEITFESVLENDALEVQSTSTLSRTFPWQYVYTLSYQDKATEYMLPVEDLDVFLVDAAGRRIRGLWNPATFASGEFTFHGLDAGDYRIEVKPRPTESGDRAMLSARVPLSEDLPGFPKVSAMKGFLQRRGVDTYLDVKFGDPAYAFLLDAGSDQQMKYIEAIEHHMPLTDPAAFKTQTEGKFVSIAELNYMARRYGFAYPQSSIRYALDLGELFKLGTESNGIAVVSADSPNPHLALLEEALHAGEAKKAVLDRTAMDAWADEAINSVAQLLILPAYFLKVHKDGYLSKNTSAEYSAIQQRYVRELGIDANRNMRGFLAQLADDIQNDAQIEVDGQKVKLITVLGRTPRTYYRELSDDQLKTRLLNRIEEMQASEVFSKYTEIFTGWTLKDIDTPPPDRAMLAGPAMKVTLFENHLKASFPTKQIREVSFDSLFSSNPYGFRPNRTRLNETLGNSDTVIKLTFPASPDFNEMAKKMEALKDWSLNSESFHYDGKDYSWGFILAELLKNAYVHGNQLSSETPAYIYIDLSDHRMEIYDLANPNASPEALKAAEDVGLHGRKDALRIIRNLPGLVYESTQVDGGAVARVRRSLSEGAPSDAAMLARRGQAQMTAAPGESVFARNSVDQPRVFELGRVTIDAKQWHVFAREELKGNEYGLRFAYSEGATAPETFEDRFRIDVSQTPQGTWQIHKVEPFSLTDEGLIKQFRGTGAADMMLDYILEAAKASGREVTTSGFLGFIAARMFMERAANGEAWPAIVQTNGSAARTIDQNLLDTFFDAKIVGSVVIAPDPDTSFGDEVRLIAEGQGRYTVDSAYETRQSTDLIYPGVALTITPEGKVTNNRGRSFYVTSVEHNPRFSGWRQTSDAAMLSEKAQAFLDARGLGDMTRFRNIRTGRPIFEAEALRRANLTVEELTEHIKARLIDDREKEIDKTLSVRVDAQFLAVQNVFLKLQQNIGSSEGARVELNKDMVDDLMKVKNLGFGQRVNGIALDLWVDIDSSYVNADGNLSLDLKDAISRKAAQQAEQAKKAARIYNSLRMEDFFRIRPSTKDPSDEAMLSDTLRRSVYLTLLAATAGCVAPQRTDVAQAPVTVRSSLDAAPRFADIRPWTRVEQLRTQDISSQTSAPILPATAEANELALVNEFMKTDAQDVLAAYRAYPFYPGGCIPAAHALMRAMMRFGIDAYLVEGTFRWGALEFMHHYVVAKVKGADGQTAEVLFDVAADQFALAPGDSIIGERTTLVPVIGSRDRLGKFYTASAVARHFAFNGAVEEEIEAFETRVKAEKQKRLERLKKGLGDRVEGLEKTKFLTPNPSTLNPDKVGGIDFNPKKVNLEVGGDGMTFEFTFDPAQLENLKIDGFVPVIIDIQPLQNLPVVLGIRREEDAAQLTMVN